jgi:hypothetical protein
MSESAVFIAGHQCVLSAFMNRHNRGIRLTLLERDLNL